MAKTSVLKFENRFLTLEINTQDVTFNVTDKSTGVVWRMASSSTQDLSLQDDQQKRTQHALSESKRKTVLPARHGLPGANLLLNDLGIGIHICLDGHDVTVEIERLNGQGPAFVRDVLFPRHFLLPKSPDAYTTWTVGQGSIVPANSTSRFHHPEGYSEQEMCWHGGYNGGSGFIAIAETPYDLYIAMNHLEKEAPATFIHWLPSHSDLHYTRRVRYTFDKGLDFVKQAKMYRQHMKEQGFFVSLADKARKNPNVAKLKGAVVINSLTCQRRMRNLEYVCNTFSDQAIWAEKLRKDSGIKNAIVHVDGWGKYGYDAVHPEVLPPNAEAGGAGALKAFREKIRDMGWLFGLHDQYIDIYKEAPSYNDSRLMIRENGKPNILNVWAGGLCSHMCVSESLKFVRRNYVEGVRDQYMYHNSKSIFDICDPDASYLDCFCRIHECYNPLHPLTRAEVAHYTRECLRVVREHGKGVVQSCEHPKFYGVPDLDFGWGVGHLTADVQVVGGGSATEKIGIPVPLWHLVFHDAIWMPEYGADYATMFLYASGPYLNNVKQGVPAEELAMKKKVCDLNAVAGFDEMTDFKVLDGGSTMQSEFSSGVRVSVNKKEKTYRVQGVRNVATKGNERLP